MMQMKTLVLAGAAVAGAIALGAATRPAALNPASGGLWEVTGLPGARGAFAECVADPMVLAQFEHRGKTCTRIVISDQGNAAVIEYSCPGGGFGRSKVTVITPRSLRIETQGISDKLPFNYVLQARRVGNCPGK